MSDVVKITASGARLTAAGRARMAENARKAGAVSIANARERVAARLEDLEFLADHDVTRVEAAERAGFPSVSALERFLNRQRRTDLLRRLPLHRASAESWWAA